MPNYEGLTVEDAIQKGLVALKLTKAEVDVKILEEGKKGFLGIGKKEAVVSLTPISAPITEEPIKEVVAKAEIAVDDAMTETPKVLEKLSDSDAMTELALYLTNITKELNAPAMVRVERHDEHITFHLDSDKAGMLIGKHGRVLNALQYLAQVFIHRTADHKLSVIVNVGDYRERREATLTRLANNTADKVKRTGQSVFLEPMPAFERKQIHAILTAHEHVQTHSEGDEPFRYLVVEPRKVHG
ncbi:protein jag [Vagococcus sp. BWB3-3]|uniref:RNA-binding protein KhpB n=1 Tax=Vagococcus allomyrinae TaxID=2794353 RepID=A0A940P5E5_9ENTE|nr:protein jag [Vagococcus allomyrinae]